MTVERLGDGEPDRAATLGAGFTLGAARFDLGDRAALRRLLGQPEDRRDTLVRAGPAPPRPLPPAPPPPPDTSGA